MTSPPRRASPPPPLHRQVSTTVAPTNRSDRPSLLAWNLNTHVVLGNLRGRAAPARVQSARRKPRRGQCSRGADEQPGDCKRGRAPNRPAHRNDGSAGSLAHHRFMRSNALHQRSIGCECGRPLQLKPTPVARWLRCRPLGGSAASAAVRSAEGVSGRLPDSRCPPAKRKLVKCACVPPLRDQQGSHASLARRGAARRGAARRGGDSLVATVRQAR